MSTKHSSASYNLILQKLYALKGSYGLEAVKKAAEQLNHPEKAFKSVHVGGSNGKGSVSTKIAKALEHEGFKCGLFTSPHIHCYRERIQMNGEMIPEADVERILTKLMDLKLLNSFFELTTMLAFCWFAEQKVDWAVIEVGLGGRLDATNILQPQLAIITSISLEHTEILGSTLEKIFKEKRGIFKLGVPALLGPRVPDFKSDEPVERVAGEFESYDDENSATARRGLEMLGVSVSSIHFGINHRPPCRAEWVQENVLFDVAHNPDGISQLLKLLQSIQVDNLHFLIGFSINKDVVSALKLLVPVAASFCFTQAVYHPCYEAEELGKICLDLGYKGPIILEKKPQEAMKHRLLNLNKKDLLVVTGTFYIMKEAKEALNLPAKDPS